MPAQSKRPQEIRSQRPLRSLISVAWTVLPLFPLLDSKSKLRKVSVTVLLLIISAKKPPKASCQAVVDVGFILDSSGSLSKDYGKEKDFLKTLAAAFGVSSNASRAGVVTFSYFSELSVKLSDHGDISSFKQAVDNIPLMGSTTRIDKALRLAQKELFSLGNGGRAGVPKLLILLTDGSQTQDAGAEDPGDIAEELRADGINILVVGIGNGINATELAHIAGEQKKVYSADTFDKLIGPDFVTSIKKDSCDIGNAVVVCKSLSKSKQKAMISLFEYWAYFGRFVSILGDVFKCKVSVISSFQCRKFFHKVL